jgi:hypothetical protein
MLLGAASPSPLAAQTASATATAAISTEGIPPRLAGTWTGTLQTVEWTATLKVTMQEGDSGAKGIAMLTLPGQELNGPIRQVALDGNEVTWLCDIQGAEVHFTGGFEGKAFGGHMEAYVNGQIIAQGDWNLAREAVKE